MTRRLFAPVIVGLALALTACSNTTEPEPSASETALEPGVATNFCDAMFIVTETEPHARAALSALYDEMANEEIYAPGADFSAINDAGTEVLAQANAYLASIEQARSFADDTVDADFDAIAEYWTTYALALGQVASDAPDYRTFEAGARPILEDPATNELRLAQLAAADAVLTAYSSACSGQ